MPALSHCANMHYLGRQHQLICASIFVGVNITATFMAVNNHSYIFASQQSQLDLCQSTITAIFIAVHNHSYICASQQSQLYLWQSIITATFVQVNSHSYICASQQ